MYNFCGKSRRGPPKAARPGPPEACTAKLLVNHHVKQAGGLNTPNISYFSCVTILGPDEHFWYGFSVTSCLSKTMHIYNISTQTKQLLGPFGRQHSLVWLIFLYACTVLLSEPVLRAMYLATAVCAQQNCLWTVILNKLTASTRQISHIRQAHEGASKQIKTFKRN